MKRRTMRIFSCFNRILLPAVSILLSFVLLYCADGGKTTRKLTLPEILPGNWTPLQPESRRPSTIHVSQAGSGNNTGINQDNTHSVEWFNTSSNWSDSTDLVDGLIGPGDVVEFHGEITTRLAVKGSGAAGDGNSIQIVFADDGIMNVPTVTDNRGIPEEERTQIYTGIYDYLTLINARFSSAIGHGDLPDTYNDKGIDTSPEIPRTAGHSLVFIGFRSSYSGEPENIRIQNCNHDNANHENNLAAVMLRSGNNILLEGNRFNGIQRGFNSADVSSHSITIRNNSLIGFNDSSLAQSERYARLQDIIRIGAMHRILIEGNHLSLRKWIADGELSGDRAAYHSDIIQTFGVNSGGVYYRPGEIILRYNLIESDCSPNIDRSWLMCANLTGYFYVYGNVFLGINGASNGIRMQSDDPRFISCIFNNTVIAKGGQGNIIALSRSYNAAAASGERYYLVNNIIYMANDRMGVIYGNTTNPPVPLNLHRSNNIYYAEADDGADWAYAGYSREEWLAGEPNSEFTDPIFADYANCDFSLLPDSPAIDSGITLDEFVFTGLAKGSAFPGPQLAKGSSGSGINIGAYEN